MSNLDEQIAANVLEAQKLTRKFFVTELDYSDQSVEHLERQFDAIEFSLKGGKSPENIQMLSRVWGSYLGEVIRRRNGGAWVVVPGEHGDRWALRCPVGDLFPLEVVRKRLDGDASANVWSYLKTVEIRERPV